MGRVGLQVGLFVAVAAMITGWWWWLGSPVPLQSSPLPEGGRFPCVSYAPFRANQTPLDLSTRIDPVRIDEDLAQLARITDCVRTYSTDLGLDRIADLAGKHGLRVIQGIWLSSQRERNRTEIATAVDIARRNPGVIRAIVIGNEVLLRGEMSQTDLAEAIRTVKAQVSVPVTYADVWEFWLRNRELAPLVDFISVHILPYWEDVPVPASNAAEHVLAIRRQVGEQFPGREILIGEVGWPSAGRMREGALPSPSNQALVLRDVVNGAKRAGYDLNVIEAFDQPWKRQLEGTVGGHWGLLDAETREPKFAWGMPVSDHPNWIWQALGGIALALATFAVAIRAMGQSEARPHAWFGVAGIALVAGAMIGWAVETAPVESLGIGGWLRSAAFLLVSVLCPLVAAAASVRGQAIPGFAKVLGGHGVPSSKLERVLGLVLVAAVLMTVHVALSLLFDPRYKDFPFAPLSAVIFPLAVVSGLSGPRAGRRGRAEQVGAALLTGAVVYFIPNEGLANWQALWVGTAVLTLALVLLRAKDEPG